MSDEAPISVPRRRKGPLQVPCLHNPHHTEIETHIKGEHFVWIDLEAPSEHDICRVGELIKLHPLTIEDALTFHQRPKIEEYADYYYLVVFGVDPVAKSGDPLLREVHMIISPQALITIHGRPYAAVDELGHRYSQQPVRSEQFLVYKVLDALTSTFIPVLERTDQTIDDLEEQIFEETSSEQLQQIFKLKRDLVAMRRVLTPMRDMFQRNSDRMAELPGLDTDDKLYFRDLYDGLIRISEIVDSYRDLLSGTADLYQSQVANTQGDINRQLTIVATIFLPLTFLTGFFGQNFETLTGHVIDTEWSFWVLGIGLLFASVVAMAWWFWRKGWLGSSPPRVTAPEPEDVGGPPVDSIPQTTATSAGETATAVGSSSHG